MTTSNPFVSNAESAPSNKLDFIQALFNKQPARKIVKVVGLTEPTDPNLISHNQPLTKLFTKHEQKCCSFCLKLSPLSKFSCEDCVNRKTLAANQKYELELALKQEAIKVHLQTLRECREQCDKLRKEVARLRIQNSRLQKKECMSNGDERFLMGCNQPHWNHLFNHCVAIKKYAKQIEDTLPQYTPLFHELLASQELQIIQSISSQLTALPAKITLFLTNLEQQAKKQQGLLQQAHIKLQAFLQAQKEQFAKNKLELSNESTQSTLQPLWKDKQKVELALKSIGELKLKGDGLLRMGSQARPAQSRQLLDTIDTQQFFI